MLSSMLLFFLFPLLIDILDQVALDLLKLEPVSSDLVSAVGVVGEHRRREDPQG